MINSVTTQGSPTSADWVTSYKIQYSSDASTWSTVLSTDGTDRLFTGNSDQVTENVNAMPAGLAAHYVRLVPVAASGMKAVQMKIGACKLPRKNTSTCIMSLTIEQAFHVLLIIIFTTLLSISLIFY